MKQGKKVSIEQGEKKIVLEQYVEDIMSKTPHWNKVMNVVKEGGAKNVEIFVHSFIQSLIPVTILILCMMLGIYVMCS